MQKGNKRGGWRTMKEGCGKKFIKNGNVILSIKCGDWSLDERKVLYCEGCVKQEESA